MLRFWLKSRPAQGIIAALLLGFLLSTDLRTYAGDATQSYSPLGGLLLSLIPAFWQVLMGYGLFAASLLLVFYEYTRSASGERSMLPLFFAVAWGMLEIQPPGTLLIGSIALLCIASTVRIMLREDQMPQQASMVHRSGAMLGVGALLCPPVALFILLPPVVLFYRGALRFSRILPLLMGFIIPGSGVLVTSYLLDLPAWSHMPTLADWLPLLGGDGALAFPLRWPALLLWGAVLLLWILYVLLDRKPRVGRVSSYLLGRGVLRTWVLLSLGVAAVSPHCTAWQMLLAFPLGMTLTRFFSERAHSRMVRPLFELLLIGTLLVLTWLRLPLLPA